MHSKMLFACASIVLLQWWLMRLWPFTIFCGSLAMHQTMHHTLASGMASHGMANKQIALVWQKVWILMGIKCIYKYMYMYV